jgi:hypothetical protein
VRSGVPASRSGVPADSSMEGLSCWLVAPGASKRRSCGPRGSRPGTLHDRLQGAEEDDEGLRDLEIETPIEEFRPLIGPLHGGGPVGLFWPSHGRGVTSSLPPRANHPCRLPALLEFTLPFLPNLFVVTVRGIPFLFSRAASPQILNSGRWAQRRRRVTSSLIGRSPLRQPLFTQLTKEEAAQEMRLRSIHRRLPRSLQP